MTNAAPSSPGGGGDGGKAVSFNKADALRIANVVQRVERGDRGLGPSKLPRAAGGGGASGFFRVEITGSLTCGGETTGAVLTWNGSGYDSGEEVTVHDPLFLISSTYSGGQRCWCAYMDDSEKYEVVMPGSECSCTGVSRERLAGMVFSELEAATTANDGVLVIEDGCLKLMPTTTCNSVE